MFGFFGGRARPPTDNCAVFGEFLRARGAYVAQKTVFDYCRVKAGRREHELFADPSFAAALEHCRWQVFFAALGDVTALAEAHLRPHARGRERDLAAGLVDLHAGALAAEAPPPAELEARDQASGALARRLATLQLAPPAAPHRMPLEAEPLLFATLPVAPEQRRGESEAIRGGLRMHIVSTQQEMERRFHASEMAALIMAASQ